MLDWLLEPGLTFLNHGSFGACPRPVLEAQLRWRWRMERQPVRFFVRDLFDLYDAARREAAAFVGADPEGFVFVPNATYGINSVLRELPLRPGDELLTTDHAYGACRNALEHVARPAGARVVVARVPFPLSGPDAVVEAVLAAVTARTRLALIDHVTSPTGLVLPIQRLVRALERRGVDTLVDGAHAPGMLPLDLERIGAAWYAGNFHKWVCAPKGAAFLYARADKRGATLPLAISHGYAFPVAGRSRFHATFDWTGTHDPTPAFTVPDAIRIVGEAAGGWDAVRARNRALALQARRLLCDALQIEPPCPDSMVGALAAVPLPDGDERPPSSFLHAGDPLQTALLERHAIEVPVIAWPAAPRRVLRASAQLYNTRADFERLAAALRAELR